MDVIVRRGSAEGSDLDVAERDISMVSYEQK